MKKLLLLVTLLFNAALQAEELKFIQLHNRQADELIPVVQPMLDAEDAITGSGYQLIVRTSAQRFAQIESLVRQLDTAPQQLTISVRQGDSLADSVEEYSASGSVSSGNIRIGVDGPPGSSRGGTISGGNRSGSGSVRAYNSTRHQSGNLSQRVMVLEGQWATINAGQLAPRRTQTPYGTEVQYQNITSGFDVRPRLSGSEVTLEIAPYRRKRSSAQSDTLDTQSIDTTVRGELGEWLEIGGVDESSGGNESGIGYTSGSQRSDSRSVWLKVELAH